MLMHDIYLQIEACEICHATWYFLDGPKLPDGLIASTLIPESVTSPRACTRQVLDTLDQLAGGLAPPGVRPCWAHMKKRRQG